MTKAILLFLAIAAGATLWHRVPQRKEVAAAPPVHLAPEGVYFLTEYVSVPIRGGVIGWVPGQPLREVAGSTHPEGSRLLSDGTLRREVECAKLTQDVDEAATVRAVDERMQSQIKAWIAGNRALAAARQREYAILTVADLERAARGLRAIAPEDNPAAAGPSADAAAQERLDRLARSVRSGNPAPHGKPSEGTVSSLVEQQRDHLHTLDTIGE